MSAKPFESLREPISALRVVLKHVEAGTGRTQEHGVTRARQSEGTLDRLRQAYLRTLSRLPDDREKAVAVKHLKEADDVLAGLRDLMWALVNTKEFIVNR